MRRLRPTALAMGLCVACVPGKASAFTMDDSTLGTLLRYFTDSKHVAVRSYMGDYTIPLSTDASLLIHYNNERVTVPAIQAPVGSQEAVDAITTASRPISGNAYTDYVKVRNELVGELNRGGSGLEYYYSTESDYLAQLVGGHVSRDVMNQQLNLSVGSSYGWDAIEPLADDDTNTGVSHKNTLHLDAVATRILSPKTLVRLGLEVNQVEGLQHNPYRNVYAGGTNVPERSPDHRQRRDAFLKLNQYLANRSSMKLSYRFYNDDWGVTSHEIESTLSQYVTSGLFAQYQYRYYTQTAAYFYMPEYPTVNGVDGYLTGDYRLSNLSSHLFGASLNFDMATLAADVPALRRLGVRLDYERYFNSNNYSADILETGIDFRF